MAASACLPLILQSRVFSSTEFGSNGGNDDYPKPWFLPFQSSSASSRSCFMAFARSNKKFSPLSQRNLSLKKKTTLDAFMAEEEEDFIEESRKEQKYPLKKKTALDDFMAEEEEEEDFIEKPRKNKKFNQEEQEEENTAEEGLEAFFSQLERDISKYNSSEEEDLNGELKEEDAIKFEKELTNAFEEEDDVMQLPKLKTWQMRKLAHALKIGRRKAGIKKLSEDVCLERPTVLEFLKNPPPDLLLMSESLPDEPGPQPPIGPDSNATESLAPSTPGNAESESKHPVHGKNATESSTRNNAEEPNHPIHGKNQPEKRLKKAQVETLEKVYVRMKRPTNEMIDSIIHVTNLPRKKVMQWFEERRMQDGVPNQPPRRAVFMRSKAQTVSTR